MLSARKARRLMPNQNREKEKEIKRELKCCEKKIRQLARKGADYAKFPPLYPETLAVLKSAGYFITMSGTDRWDAYYVVSW